jgi:hypothetical protein
MYYEEQEVYMVPFVLRTNSCDLIPDYYEYFTGKTYVH